MIQLESRNKSKPRRERRCSQTCETQRWAAGTQCPCGATESLSVAARAVAPHSTGCQTPGTGERCNVPATSCHVNYSAAPTGSQDTVKHEKLTYISHMPRLYQHKSLYILLWVALFRHKGAFLHKNSSLSNKRLAFSFRTYLHLEYRITILRTTQDMQSLTTSSWGWGSFDDHTRSAPTWIFCRLLYSKTTRAILIECSFVQVLEVQMYTTLSVKSSKTSHETHLM